ncbi:hypothetical protein MMC09_005323 [Bachmanniomyces sp. S44760]|nr:hypothetical protein [Bachmanniomyces sp. S44760]
MDPQSNKLDAEEASGEIEEAMLDPNEAGEEIPDDQDHPMESDAEDDEDDEGAEEQEIQLQNDSIAHFDHHTDSIFCIAQHPLDPSVIATGGGDDTAYIFATTQNSPVLPASYESNPQPASRNSLPPIAKVAGHTDSINAIAFTKPTGQYLCTAGLDGRLRIYTVPSPPSSTTYTFLAESQEVPEINFLIPCPHPSYPNTLALGASDGSVWVYTIDPRTDPSTPLQVLQAYYLHTGPTTAGAWTPDGNLLATVSEDGSLHVWDPFGEAAARGLSGQGGGQAIIGLTNEDQRFAVEGGLYSVAINPTGAFVVVGGADGSIRVIGLPRLSSPAESASGTISAVQGSKGSGAKSKSGGGKKAGGPLTAASAESAGQAGQILASLRAQEDSIETLAFSAPPLTLLASGSVDGSIVLFDTAHRFAVRRNIKDAHDGFAVVALDFASDSIKESAAATSAVKTKSVAVVSAQSPTPYLLTSCGMDGVVKRWDTRGGTAASGQGLVREWRGHRGEGEGGGVLGFVQGGGRVVTAGDDGISLVFE